MRRLLLGALLLLPVVLPACSLTEGGATLKVTQDSGRGALHVEDQGSGIAAARLPALFDSFTSTKRTGAHVGMGLPNVRRIAVAHGGNVTVKSEEGKGSEFTIALPLQPPEA